MKRIVLITAIIMYASVQIRASHLASELNLRLFDQAWFTVNIDHQAFPNPTTKFQIKDITPGTHFLRVVRIDQGYYGHPGISTLVFQGYVEIPSAARINAMIDRHNRFRINKIFPYETAPLVYNPYYTPLAPPEPMYCGMSDEEFDHLRYTVERLSFESSKMQVVRQALSQNKVNSRQVLELARMMTFESSKLELAKMAYHQTVDKQNYFMVNDAFTFESSILDLNDYIYRS